MSKRILPLPSQEGFVCINKPVGLSSAAVVENIKAKLNCKRGVGHAGTLDPFAQGLLVIGIGRKATKLFPSLIESIKTYQVALEFGLLTDTLDNTGATVAQDSRVITRQDLEQAIVKLGSQYMQTPPLYSALKFDGKRLYKLARYGTLSQTKADEVTQSKQRIVNVYTLTIESFEFPRATISCTVSHGTYIRSLVRDLAQYCHTYATTVALNRTSVGQFTLAQAVTIEEFCTERITAVSSICLDV